MGLKGIDYQVYSFSTSSPFFSTELLLIFNPCTKRSKRSKRFKRLKRSKSSEPPFIIPVHYESDFTPLSSSPPSSSPSSGPNNLEHLGYIHNKRDLMEACKLAKEVPKDIQRPFKQFTNEVVGIWIQKGLMRWEEGCTPCKIGESILTNDTLEMEDINGDYSMYKRDWNTERMMEIGGERVNESVDYEDGDHDSSYGSSSSQHSLGRSTRKSNRHLSGARSTHHPSRRNSSSVSHSRNSNSNSQHESRSHSRPRSHYPPSSHDDRSSFHDSAISMSNESIYYDCDDDARSSISSVNPGSSVSHSHRSSYSSSPPSSHRSRSHSRFSSRSSSRSHSPTTQAPPLLSDLPERRTAEELNRSRIFEKKKAEHRDSSSHHQRPPPRSSHFPSYSDPGSQPRSRARSRTNQYPTQEFHIPGKNNPLQLSVPGPDPSVRR